jgi:hypothetical protein
MANDSNGELYDGGLWEEDWSQAVVKESGATNLGNDFQIFPNPAGEEITVQLSGNVQPEIEMFDALGRSVLAPPTTPQPPPIPLRSIGGGVRIDVSNMPSGIYFIRVSAGGYVESRSVVVAHN